MFNFLQNFLQQLYISCTRLYRTVSWEFGRYGTWDWVMLLGLLIFFCIVASFAVGMFVFCFVWPLVLLWAINLLFGTAIPLTFWTWLAVLVITWAWGRFTGVPLIKIHLKK